MKKILAIQTARANSKSVKKKNLIKINNEPIFLKSLKAAINCKDIDKVVCTTDDEVIANYSKKYNYTAIKRPKSLRGPNASHLLTIKHALIETERKDKCKYDVVILLLGNVIGVSAKALSQAIKKLKNNDSVVSVSKFNMFNPLRAFSEDGRNLIKTSIDPKYIFKTKNRNKLNKYAINNS
jgi:N-acylneuraminate cytidylyltransferase